jgi:hypothetical protein
MQKLLLVCWWLYLVWQWNTDSQNHNCMILDKEGDIKDIHMHYWWWKCSLIVGENFGNDSSFVLSDQNNNVNDSGNVQTP